MPTMRGTDSIYHGEHHRVVRVAGMATGENLVVVRLAGPMSGENIVSLFTSILADPRLQYTYNGLWDARDVTLLEVTEGDVARLIALFGEHRERMQGGKTAIVAQRYVDIVYAQLTKALLSRQSGRESRLFQDIQAAMDWLGVTCDDYDTTHIEPTLCAV